jgi:hypothetical protein
MRKIKKEEIKEIYRLLNENPLFKNFEGGNGNLFFPFEVDNQINENEQGVLLHIDKTRGAGKLIEPGFTLDGTIKVSYVSTEYAIPFYLKEYLEHFSVEKYDQEIIDALTELECFIVNKNSITLQFSYN